jgi:hypothetical protein
MASICVLFDPRGQRNNTVRTFPLPFQDNATFDNAALPEVVPGHAHHSDDGQGSACDSRRGASATIIAPHRRGQGFRRNGAGPTGHRNGEDDDEDAASGSAQSPAAGRRQGDLLPCDFADGSAGTARHLLVLLGQPGVSNDGCCHCADTAFARPEHQVDTRTDADGEANEALIL